VPGAFVQAFNVKNGQMHRWVLVVGAWAFILETRFLRIENSLIYLNAWCRAARLIIIVVQA
jgi:hypothetical protein